MFGRRRRGKVNLTYISDDSTRRVTFKKRNKNLFKKMNELTTLCDVQACAVVYDPDEGRTLLFPNDPLDVFNVISEFNKLSITEQKKKMFDQEDYLNDRITKTKEQVSRLQVDNRERRLNQLMYEFLVDQTKTFDSLSVLDLQELKKLIDRHLREFEQYFQTLGEGMPALPLLPPPLYPHPLIPMGSDDIPIGLQQVPPMMVPMGPLPSNLAARENYVQEHGNVALDFTTTTTNNNNNNNTATTTTNVDGMSVETNSMLLDQWLFDVLVKSQDAGCSSNNAASSGSDPKFGAI